jgi:hypothetical protein
MCANGTHAPADSPALRAHYARIAAYFALAFGLLFSLGVSRSACAGEAEKRAAAKIEALGGKITKDDDGKVYGVLFFPSSDLSDEAVESIDFATLSHLEYMCVAAPDITDRALVEFAKVPELKVFIIGRGQITDKGMGRFLKQQKLLRNICFISTPITDFAMPELGQLASLKAITLTNTKITDKGVKELAKLEQLVSLDLTDTDVSNAGLADIAKMTNLTHLYLNGTKITDAGIKQLGTLKKLKD